MDTQTFNALLEFAMQQAQKLDEVETRRAMFFERLQREVKFVHDTDPFRASSHVLRSVRRAEDLQADHRNPIVRACYQFMREIDFDLYDSFGSDGSCMVITRCVLAKYHHARRMEKERVRQETLTQAVKQSVYAEFARDAKKKARKQLYIMRKLGKGDLVAGMHLQLLGLSEQISQRAQDDLAQSISSTNSSSTPNIPPKRQQHRLQQAPPQRITSASLSSSCASNNSSTTTSSANSSNSCSKSATLTPIATAGVAPGRNNKSNDKISALTGRMCSGLLLSSSPQQCAAGDHHGGLRYQLRRSPNLPVVHEEQSSSPSSSQKSGGGAYYAQKMLW